MCFLAYVLWKTFAQLCKRHGLGDEPRVVFNELSHVQMVDVLMTARTVDKSAAGAWRNPPGAEGLANNAQNATTKTDAKSFVVSTLHRFLKDFLSTIEHRRVNCGSWAKADGVDILWLSPAESVAAIVRAGRLDPDLQRVQNLEKMSHHNHELDDAANSSGDAPMIGPPRLHSSTYACHRSTPPSPTTSCADDRRVIHPGRRSAAEKGRA